MTWGPTIPRAIVECIAHARAPSAEELRAVAEHIRCDLVGQHAPHAEGARLKSFRAAQAALIGCG